MTRGRFFAILIGAGFVWRLIVSARMVVPREDGVNYLWMAERFSEGEVAQALSEVFSPLLALAIAPLIALGVDPFFAGQLILAAAGSLLVLPVAAISEHLAPGTERVAAALTFVAGRLTMLGAEVYTEPLFALLGSYAFLFGLKSRYWWCGALAGLAFWVRPEAALIPLVFLGRARVTWAPLLATLVMVCSLAVWRGALGHGLDPVPKLAFIAAYNVAGDTDLPGLLTRSAAHLLDLPTIFLEAFGALGLFAVIGLFFFRPRPVVWLLVLAVAVICLYVPRWRFLVNWVFVVAPLAAVGVGRLPKPVWWISLAIAHNLFWSLTGGVSSDRVAEPRVASYLRQRLQPGQVIAGDMTRVLYFAGQRPLAPRHFEARELIKLGSEAEYVVLREGRPTTPAVIKGLSGHEALVLPGALRDLAAARGMLVLQRRRLR